MFNQFRITDMPCFLSIADARRYFKQSEIVLYRQAPETATEAVQQQQAQLRAEQAQAQAQGQVQDQGVGRGVGQTAPVAG